MDLQDLARHLNDPSLNRAEKVGLLRSARLGRDDLIVFSLNFPPGRFIRKPTRAEVRELLDDAGYNVGQAVMEVLEEGGSFERTGDHVLDRRGRRVPCYRPVETGRSGGGDRDEGCRELPCLD
jgi:hypothetical protein